MVVVFPGKIVGAVEGVESLLLLAPVPGLGQGDAGLRGEFADGFGEADPLHFHEEGEDVSPGAAGKAFVDLFVLGDIEGGAPVVVEGAEADVVFAPFGKRYVVGDDLDDVGRLPDLLDGFFRNPGHGWFLKIL